jgi:CRP-like cAMP-binding protein
MDVKSNSAEAELIELLRLHSSTRGLDDEQLRHLAAHSSVARFEEGQFAHRANDPLDHLLLIVRGQFKIAASLPNGSRKTIQYVGADEQFGLLALSEQELLPVDLVAEQNSVAVRISVENAPELLNDLPLWRRQLLGSLLPRLRESISDGKRRKPRRIIGMVHLTDEYRFLTSVLVQRLADLQEQVGLLSDDGATLNQAPGANSPLVDDRGEAKSPEKVRQIVGQWPELDRVFLDVQIDRLEDQLVALTEACDAILWIVNSDTSHRVLGELASLIHPSPGLRAKTFVIWMLNTDEQVAPFLPELSSLCEQDFKLHWNGWSDSAACSQRTGIDRIIHHLRGISIGLALGGGAARGNRSAFWHECGSADRHRVCGRVLA